MGFDTHMLGPLSQGTGCTSSSYKRFVRRGRVDGLEHTMSNKPSDCPGHSDLRGFLAGTSPEIDQSTVACTSRTARSAGRSSTVGPWMRELPRANVDQILSRRLALSSASGTVPNGLPAGPGPGAAGGARTDMPESLAGETVAVSEDCSEGRYRPAGR